MTPVIVNPTTRPAHHDAGRQLRAAERLRAHPARPLPGQPAQVEPGAEPHRPAPPGRPVRLRVRVRAATMSTLTARDRWPALRPARWPWPPPWRSPPARRSRSARSRPRRVRRRRQPGASSRSTSSPAAPRSRPARRSASARSSSQQLITPETDILLHVGRTGSPLLDARRRGTLPRLDAAHAGAGAADRRATPRSGQDLIADAAQVEVVQLQPAGRGVPGQHRGHLRADHAAAEPGLLERDQPAPTWPTRSAT